MVKLSDVKTVAKKFKLSMQQSLTVIRKADICPNCKTRGLVGYISSDGLMYECLFCDYTIE